MAKVIIMRNTHKFALGLLACGITACAVAVPKELADARSAYDRASHGQAATLAPSDLHKAKTALNDAEQAFRDNPEEQATRDRAYVALRRSQLAEVMASRAAETNVKEQAEQDLQKAQAEKQTQTTGALNQAQADLATAQQKTDEADRRTKALEERLTKLAEVKEDARGTIVTLSGSVLFPSNKATLLPAAETRLNEVSDALLSTKERGITIEGYTDSRGADDANVALSQRRAEAVRAYLVSRGYEGDRIQARGLGKSQPIASNDSAEGRANNRRVEIVLAPIK
jgi:outer membrane protein OmpA-like peptidoglycan-associated protein